MRRLLIFTFLIAELYGTGLTLISKDDMWSKIKLRGKKESCILSVRAFQLNGSRINTDCKFLKNSKKIDIICTKRKSICKTEKEILNFVDRSPKKATARTRKSNTQSKIQRYCQSIVGDSYSLMETCIEQEKNARYNISQMSVSKRIYKYCRNIVGDSYALTETCIRQEQDAKARLGY